MSSVKLFRLLPVCLFIFPALVFGQTKPEPTGDTQDVIKFETSLVQTDVMVFDKQGHFVDGLKPEQFQLKINPLRRQRQTTQQHRRAPENLPAQSAADFADKHGSENRT